MTLDGRAERSGIPVLGDETYACGRPAGHPGPCRSAQALARYTRADKTRFTRWRRSRRLHVRLAAVVEAASAEAAKRAA
jgi:hypothetical protein